MKKEYRFFGKAMKNAFRSASIAAKNNGREICGLLIDNGHFLEPLEVENKAKDSGSYLFDGPKIRAIVKAAEELNHEVVGTYHSHPASGKLKVREPLKVMKA